MARHLIDPETSQVWIDGSSSVHPIRATATGLTGWVDLVLEGDDVAEDPELGGEVRVAVERLESGNPLVDRETRRRIDARRFPEIVGTVASGSRLESSRLAVTGSIAFRGETQEVGGELSVAVDGERLVLDGSASFEVRDWGLQPPKVALLRVHPDIEVRIHLEAERE